MDELLFDLRTPVNDDVKEYIKFLADPEVSIWLEDEVQDSINFANIENYILNGWFRWSIELNKKFIGLSGLDLVDLKKNVARFFIVIGEKKYWGKGIGSEVIKKVVKHGLEKLNLRKISSDFLSPNEAVKIIHQKVGFKIDGIIRKESFRNEKWADRVILSIFKDEFDYNF